MFRDYMTFESSLGLFYRQNKDELVFYTLWSPFRSHLCYFWILRFSVVALRLSVVILRPSVVVLRPSVVVLRLSVGVLVEILHLSAGLLRL